MGVPDVVEIKRGVDGESLEEAIIYNERETGRFFVERK